MNCLPTIRRPSARPSGLTVQIRLDKAKDTELLGAMRQAGIRTVAIGFESPIDEELLAMNKHIRSNEMLSYVRTFHKFGFFIHGMFIFGYPRSESADFTISMKQRVKRFRDFVRKAKIDTVQVLLPVPLPGTALRHRLETQRRVYPLQRRRMGVLRRQFPPCSNLTSQLAPKSCSGRQGKS